MNLLVLFIVLNIVNVILQTSKSIATVKGTPLVAAASNALAYFIYTYVLIYTSIDGLAMWEKATIVAASNLVGVFIVKIIEKKIRKDKLWQIVVNFHTTENNDIISDLDSINATYNYTVMGKHTKFEIYTQTQSKSHEIAEIVKRYNGKYFVNENTASLY